MLARIVSVSLVQAKGRGWSFQESMNVPMVAVSSLTEVKEPRRMAWRAMIEKKLHEVQPGAPGRAKCRVIRWFSGRASHVRTSACLCVA